MNKTNFFFGAFLVSLGAGIFLFRENSLKQTAILQAPQVASERPVLVTGVPPLMDEEFKEVLPWTRYAPKAQGEKVTMRFVMEKQMSCNFGDYDAIAGNLNRSDEKNLLLSLESLSVEDGFKPINVRISQTEFNKGFAGKLEVPANLGPRQLGLFLCKDSDNIGRCAVKPVADINQVLRENLTQAAETLPAQAPDRIYYFQYVYVDAEGGLNIFRHSPIAKQAIQILSTKFAKTFPADTVELERMSLAKADLFSRTLTSVPLTRRNDGFYVTLPARDNARCPSVAEIDKQLREHFPTPEHF